MLTYSQQLYLTYFHKPKSLHEYYFVHANVRINLKFSKLCRTMNRVSLCRHFAHNSTMLTEKESD